MLAEPESEDLSLWRGGVLRHLHQSDDERVADDDWSRWNHVANGVGAEWGDNLDAIDRAGVFHRLPRRRVGRIDDVDASRGAVVLSVAGAAQRGDGGTGRNQHDARSHRGQLPPSSSSAPEAAPGADGGVFSSSVLGTIAGSPASFKTPLIAGSTISAPRIACSCRSSCEDRSLNTVYDWLVGFASTPPTTPASAAILLLSLIG